MPENRKKYDREFREGAVRIVYETWHHLRPALQRLHVGTFTGPAGTYQQTTTPSTEIKAAIVGCTKDAGHPVFRGQHAGCAGPMAACAGVARALPVLGSVAPHA